MAGRQSKTSRMARDFGAPIDQSQASPRLPNGMPSYNDALHSPEAWLALIDWHYSRYATPKARKLGQDINETSGPFYKLYSAVTKRGGWLSTTGLAEWSNIGLELGMAGTKSVYEKYLFSFEKTFDPFNSYYVRDEEERVRIQDIDPDLLETFPIAQSPKNGLLDAEFWRQIEVQDVTLLRGFDILYNLDHSLFEVERLQKDYPDFEVDILTQSRRIQFVKNKSTKEKQPLKEYAAKVLAEINGEGSNLESLVDFAVNIDFENWRPQIDELRKKLPKRLLWGSDDDALEDVRQHIKGMTLPQIYMKTKGCWTGGHQENMRFCSININHGPGNCEWWALDTRYTVAFRAKIKEQFYYDIFLHETQWWPDEDWCLANGFKLYYAVQKPGDIIFVGVGTLHWVRSLSPTVNSAWNVGLKSARQFEAAFDRFAVNLEINFRSLVPLHNLALDLLNFDMPSLPPDLILMLKAHVNIRFQTEAMQLRKAINKGVPLVDTSENVVSCEHCYHEILYAYAKCWPCQVQRLKGITEAPTFYCMNCFDNHKCGAELIGFVIKFVEGELNKLNVRIKEYLASGTISEPQDGLDYQYEKYRDENVYRSEFDGVDNVIDAKAPDITEQFLNLRIPLAFAQQVPHYKLGPSSYQQEDLLQVRHGDMRSYQGDNVYELIEQVETSKPKRSAEDFILPQKRVRGRPKKAREERVSPKKRKRVIRKKPPVAETVSKIDSEIQDDPTNSPTQDQLADDLTIDVVIDEEGADVDTRASFSETSQELQSWLSISRPHYKSPYDPDDFIPIPKKASS